MVTGIAPHVGGPILPPCAPTVMTVKLPQAPVTDLATLHQTISTCPAPALPSA